MNEKKGFGRTFYWVRVWVLFTVFLIVSGWALWDMKQRRDRNTWQRPLNVVLVLLRLGDIPPSATDSVKVRAVALQERLKSEFEKWHGGNESPFNFSVYGPLDVTQPPPSSQGEGFWQLASFAYEQWRYLGKINRQVGVPYFGTDSRIYLLVRPASGELQFVEGQSQEGGRVGIVEVQLSDSMVDFALFVATHELFHTLNATDKYDEYGRARMPDGLAEPDKTPVFPQSYVEVMARNRPLDAENEVPPQSLDELRVGAATAKEIGWIK